MTDFNAAQVKTSEKMSDLVMEYVSQFIARDFLETYERAAEEGRLETASLLPAEFDDRIYKKITKLAKRRTGREIKPLRGLAFFAAAAVCLACVAFTAFVLLSGGLREEVLNIFFSGISNIFISV